MRTLTAIAMMLSLAVAAPVAAKRVAPPAGRGAIRLQAFAAQTRVRMMRGVRRGLITADERTALMSQIGAFRERIQAVRQSGTTPSPEDRASLREDAKKIRQAIRAAVQNDDKTKAP